MVDNLLTFQRLCFVHVQASLLGMPAMVVLRVVSLRKSSTHHDALMREIAYSDLRVFRLNQREN